MDGVSIKVTNKDRLFARFRRLAPTADRELTLAALKSAEEVANLAKRFVPVRSGALRDSITFDAVEGKPAAQATAGDAKAYYAGWVEHGTTKNKAQPFMWPAYRLLKKRIVSRMGRALSKSAKAVAAK